MGSRSQAGQELDKLKRRLIRSVARLIKEKKTEDEVWDEMRKECGGKCKKLWMRMRSLTLKKLKRLIDADDRTEFVPAVARMNLTDWLLYDLVLVHEKIDVINRSETGDSKVLNNLFALVQRYQIEGRSGDDLAEAWIAATVSYNSRGHQCSPMLMQRRWYQLKELTRHKLYQFWFNYRGNKRLLIAAKQNPPTALQRAVALRFPEIITKEFPSWEDRIETNLVIMPEEFEIKMNKKDLMKPFDEAVPDVVIVEKKIDTITVESDSDFDDDGNDKEPNPEVRGKDEPSQTPVIVQVKTEPEDPYNDIDITEHPVYAEEPKDRFQDAIERLTIEEDRLAMSHVNTDEAPQEEYVMPLITNVVGAVTDTEFFNISTTNINMEKEKENSPNVFISEVKKRVEENKKSTIVSFAINEELENVVKTFDDNSQESIVIDDDEDDVMSNTPDAGQIASNVIDITSPKAKVNEIDNNRMTCIARNAYSDKTNIVESSNANEVSPVITTILSGSAVKAKMEIDTDFENEDNVGGEILKVVRDAEDLEEDIIQIEHEKEHSVSSSATIIETNVADDGFEFADDGIEFDEDHNDQSEMNEIPEKESSPEENADTPKFDLKLLMHPVVYTTKLDDIDACKGRSFFNTIDDKCLVDKIFLESKPVSIKSVNVEQIKAENDEEGNDILVKGEEFDDDLFQNESSNDSENSNSGINDCNRVKPTSFLLQKPRSRSYNPIQLCKNPDFNTRLKRLPLGFFSSERNRVFLKACKPMTIDLSKAFESKLINGTMYLKPSDSTITSVVKDVDDSGSSASITPSAVAVQSLMDTTDVDKILQDELIKRMLERNKTINLPNISVVRQINQKLLMAEVAPIITQVEKSTHEAQVQALDNSTVDKTNNINMQNKEVTNGKPTNVDKQTLQVNEITNQSSTNSLKPTILLMHSSSTNIEKQTTLMNSDKSDQDIVSDSLLPMKNNDKSREDKTLEKQKKKYSKLNVHKPLWLSKYTHFDTKPNESLLTIDTLYRVLNALDPSSVEYKKPKSKGQKSTASKFGKPQGSTSSNKPSNQNQPINNQDSSVQITTNSEDLIEQALANLPSDPSTSLTTTPQVTTPSTTVLTSTKTAKTKASNLTKKQRNCCWSRAKINKLNGLTNVRENKHKCPPAHCRCCCREILRQTEINLEIQLLENMQNRDQFDETIEQVVQQSRNSPHVTQCVTQVNTTLLEATQNQQVLPMLSSVQPFDHHDLYKDNAFLLPQPASKINVAKQADVDDYESVTIVNNAPEDTEPQLIIDTDISDNVPEETIDLVDDDDVSEIPTPTPKIRVYSAGPSLTSRPIRDLSSRKKNRNDEQHYPTPLPLELAVAAPQAPPVLPRNPTPPILPPVGTPLPKVLHKGSKVAAKITKTPGTASTSTLEDVINTLPCSCRPNVVVDKLSAMLVVDGSNECPQHTKSRVSKETRIYLNRRHMSAATRPFYVGKNKILLTNITPRKAEPPPPAPPPQTTPLELPAGVQIVLLPDGTVSYLLDPGAELTHEQKQGMPAILASILEHIKASGITLPVDVPEEENTNINSDIDNKNNENSNVNVSENNNANESSMSMSKPNDNDIVQTELRKETNQETSNEVNSLSENQKDLEKEINQETSVLNSNTDDSATDVERCIQEAQEKNDLVQDTASKDTNNLVENDKTDNIADNATTNNTAENEKTSNILVSSSRNLLSDLMEMSGILEEDINPIQQPVNTGSIHSLTIDTSRNSSVQSERPVSPVPEKHVISARINETIYNLNPITSFAELKYACDNNGLFFKLDLNNGLIVPINVCIQKTPESAAKTVNPSEVIDLTDEQNFTIEEPATSGNIQPKPAIEFDLTSRPKPSIKVNKHGKSKIKLHIIKPKDMSMMLENPRRRGRLPKYNSQLPENQMEIDNETPPAQEITSPVQSSIEERKALMKKLSNNLKPLKFHHDKRSPIILRKNSLLNTNTPIGKRISNLNNKPETEIYTETEYLESTDDSDDDDEPLAKIARKMRPNETGEQANSQDQRASQGNDNGDEVDFEEAIDAISEVEPPTILNTLLNDVPMVEPVPTQLVVSGTALEQPLPTELNDSLSFVVDESDQDSDGDCILGV